MKNHIIKRFSYKKYYIIRNFNLLYIIFWVFSYSHHNRHKIDGFIFYTLYLLAESLGNHRENNMKSVFSKTVIKLNISLFDMLWLNCVCLSFKEKIFWIKWILCTHERRTTIACARVLCVTNLPSKLCKAENFLYPIFNNKF